MDNLGESRYMAASVTGENHVHFIIRADDKVHSNLLSCLACVGGEDCCNNIWWTFLRLQMPDDSAFTFSTTRVRMEHTLNQHAAWPFTNSRKLSR